MDAEVATGGLMLLGGLGVFVLVVICLAAAMVSGYNKVDAFDRRRAIEKNLRNQVSDLDAQQRAARKIMKERGL